MVFLQNVKPLSDDHASALQKIYERYTAYLDAFGPDEAYLRKKVETELGTKMIHLKMRCGGLSSEWGKVKIFFSHDRRCRNFFRGFIFM